MQLSAFPWVQDNPPNPPMSISLLESVQQHVQQEGPHTLTSQTAMYRDKKVLIHVFSCIYCWSWPATETETRIFSLTTSWRSTRIKVAILMHWSTKSWVNNNTRTIITYISSSSSVFSLQLSLLVLLAFESNAIHNSSAEDLGQYSPQNTTPVKCAIERSATCNSKSTILLVFSSHLWEVQQFFPTESQLRLSADPPLPYLKNQPVMLILCAQSFFAGLSEKHCLEKMVLQMNLQLGFQSLGRTL